MKSITSCWGGPASVSWQMSVSDLRITWGASPTWAWLLSPYWACIDTTATMIARTIFSEEHEIFRSAVRRFIETEIVPHHRTWEREGLVPRGLWRKAGEQGLLCANVEEAYGGSGGDWLYNVLVIEELARAGVSGPGSGFMVH